MSQLAPKRRRGNKKFNDVNRNNAKRRNVSRRIPVYKTCVVNLISSFLFASIILTKYKNDINCIQKRKNPIVLIRILYIIFANHKKYDKFIRNIYTYMHMYVVTVKYLIWLHNNLLFYILFFFLFVVTCGPL